MLRAIFSTLIVIFFVGSAFSQNEEIVSLTGKVLSSKDSSAVSTNIFYEKLPYYDDMGITNADTDGTYAFNVVKGVTYNVSIRKDPFKAFSKEVTISGDEEVNFYLDIDVESEIIRLDNVNFARGSDVLQQESFAELDQLHDRMRQNHEMVIQLEGHTDFAGNPTANISLSQARVDAVKKYLTKSGINKNRILTKAFGGTHPLSKERTPQAMAKNRRVEVRIIKK